MVILIKNVMVKTAQKIMPIVYKQRDHMWETSFNWPYSVIYGAVLPAYLFLL